MSSSAEALREELRRIRQKRAQLAKTKEHLRKATEEKKLEIAEKERVYEELNRAYLEVRRRREIAEKEASELEQAVLEDAQLDQEHEKLNATLQLRKTETRAVVDELREAQQLYSELQDYNADLIKQKERSAAMVTKLEQRRLVLKEAQTSANATLQLLEENREANLCELAAKEEHLKNLRAKIHNGYNLCRGLEASVGQQNEEIATIGDKLEKTDIEFKAKKASIDAVNAEIEAEKRHLQEVEAQLETGNNDFLRVQSELSDNQQTVSQLRAEVESVKRFEGDAQQLKRNLHASRQKNATLRRLATSQNAEHRAMVDVLNRVNAENDADRDDIRIAVEQCGSIERQNKEDSEQRAAEIAALKLRLDDARRQDSEARTQLEYYRARMRTAPVRVSPRRGQSSPPTSRN